MTFFSIGAANFILIMLVLWPILTYLEKKEMHGDDD